MQILVENHLERYALAAPKRILVATDLTDTDLLVPHAIAQAKATGAQVTLVHALPPSEIMPADGAVIPYGDRTKLLRDVRVSLLSVARQFELAGIVCDTAVREGIPSDVIPEELRLTNATRLIMASHGRGKLGQWVMGSVAHELITSLRVPIFIIGPRARTIAQHVTPRRVLHPVSLMGSYRESLDLAFDIAQAYRAELILLHVLDQHPNPTLDSERAIEWANTALKALIPGEAKPAPPVRTMVTSGKLAEEILKAVDQTDADWIVLGADGVAGVWPFNDSEAYKVLTAANCPVLTLRHELVRMQPAADLAEVHFTSPL